MSRICIGVATKPQALKGQFRVNPEPLNDKLYKKLTQVYIDDICYDVESVSLRDTFVIVKLAGIDSCEKAELFRNKEIFADIEETIESHFDLIDFVVVVDSKELGRVVDINNYGSKDVVSVAGEINIMFPLVDNLVESTDEKNKKIVLNSQVFEQVAVYED